MFIEVGQTAVETAKSGGIIVAIPTGVIASIATLAIIKGSDLILGRMKGKKNGDGKGPKPGEGLTCKQHGEDIAVLNEFKDDTKKALDTIGTDIKTLLGRVPAK